VSDPTIITLIDDHARDLRFARWGICPADPSDYADAFRAYIRGGKHGEMDWLARNVDVRLDPSTLEPGIRTLIMVSDLYEPRGTGARTEPAKPNCGKIARYARGRDYHVSLKKRLHRLADALRVAYPGDTFRAFVDTAPVLERECAARAGLGWIAKHTLLIDPDLGSYLFIGGLATTLAIPVPAAQRTVPDHCGSCTACVDACPTGAITPYAVDARCCISYLTIEHRGPIGERLQPRIGDWFFGCDICQEVCPHNSPAAAHPNEADRHPDYLPKRRGVDLRAVATWGPEQRMDAVRGSAMKRAKLPMMHRNAGICLANERRCARGGESTP
jgi:epoxyqueuosine reductase